MKQQLNIFWMRRDIRLDDNHALYEALKSNVPVAILFIFDTEILNELPKRDKRLNLIYDELEKLQRVLKTQNSSLIIRHGRPVEVFEALLGEYKLNSVFVNEDYEPYATDRDYSVEELLKESSVSFNSYKDQVILAPGEVLKKNGEMYKVFTPYYQSWKKLLGDVCDVSLFPSEDMLGNLALLDEEFPALESLGYRYQHVELPGLNWSDSLLRNYAGMRDLPAKEATTKMSVHLRFGLISVRKLLKRSWRESEEFVRQLAWRDFYMMILYHRPDVVSNSFKKEYDEIQWRNNEQEFYLWCNGQTGFPMVDAGMRQLNETGYMHNRLRMITASFLCKDLLIDWRLGEAYFAAKLLDFDLAANNGGWQWASGSGCDAAPYFRVFNPETQQKKFDPDFEYIKKWVPEYGTDKYPEPIVNHGEARVRAIRVYQAALKRK